MAAARELALRDPAEAVRMVEAEPNLLVRRRLRQAVLQGWAATHPEDALAWAMTFRDADNREAVEAVLRGAARNPERAISLTQQLCTTYPALSEDYGNALIAGLAAEGQFTAAAQFATHGPTENRARWLSNAFSEWAQADPLAALEAGRQLGDGELRNHALDGVFLGWAQADPAALAGRALAFPEPEERKVALSHALSQWLQYDPAAASRWLEGLESRPELDSGMLSLATLPTLVQHRPEVATEWALAITSPEVRAGALRLIAQQWAGKDLPGAQRFLQSPSLRAEDRTAWTEGLQEATHPVAAGGGRAVPVGGDPRP